MDAPHQAIQSRLRKAFDPYVNFILAGGNIFEVNILVLIRGRIIRRGERKHHRAHLGVNVAENVRYSFTGEDHIFRLSRFIQTEIESLPVKQRKDVVKERIGVRKRDHASYRYDQQVRREHPVFLDEREAAGGHGPTGRFSGDRGKPKDRRGRMTLKRAWREFNASMQFRDPGGLRILRRSRQGEKRQPAEQDMTNAIWSVCTHHQNL